MKKIGLFGGTFDPPHIGHIKLANTILTALNLDEIWFIPTYQPPHKSEAIAQPESRLDMLKLLINDQKHFQISTIEFEQKGKSYTYQTVKQLKRQYPNTQFYFIIGGDMVDYLPKWYKIDELKKLVQFIGVKRKGYEAVNHNDVIMVEMENIPVSSTGIRNDIKMGRIPRGLTDEVLQYIRENRLYEN